MTDYKKLCAELVEIWDNTSDPDYWDFGDAAKYLVIRVRAALAEPEPEGPTDEELKHLLYFEFTTSTGHGHSEDPIGFARAVLARWGK